MSCENIYTGTKLELEEREGERSQSVCNISPCSDSKGIQACGSDGKCCKLFWLHCMVGITFLILRSDLWLFSALAFSQMQCCRCALLTSLKAEKDKIDWSITQIIIRVITSSSVEDNVSRCGSSWHGLLFQKQTNFIWSWYLVSYSLL